MPDWKDGIKQLRWLPLKKDRGETGAAWFAGLLTAALLMWALIAIKALENNLVIFVIWVGLMWAAIFHLLTGDFEHKD